MRDSLNKKQRTVEAVVCPYCQDDNLHKGIYVKLSGKGGHTMSRYEIVVCYGGWGADTPEQALAIIKDRRCSYDYDNSGRGYGLIVSVNGVRKRIKTWIQLGVPYLTTLPAVALKHAVKFDETYVAGTVTPITRDIKKR